MRADREISNRMRQMLTRDKIGVKEGFATALSNDCDHLLNDYFDLDGRAVVKIEQTEDGEYFFSVTGRAKRIKHFDTTADIKRY